MRMQFLLFVISGLALAWAMLLQSRINAIETIMDSMGSTLRNLSAAVGALDQRLNQSLELQRVKALKDAGLLQFKPDTKVRVALATHLRVADVFQQHTINSSELTEAQRDSTLESLAAAHSIDIDKLLHDLNALLDDIKPEDVRQEELITLE